MSILLDFIFPLIILCGSCVAAAYTAIFSLVTLDLSAFESLPSFRERWYANLWKVLGEISYKSAKPHVEPLIPEASGVVLDIGMGTGHWLYLYNPDKITKIYAVEPNKGQHATLLRKAKEAGLEDIFELVSMPVADLEKRGITRESVDSIVTVKVLCSVPDPERVIKDPYTYLNPGGCWIVFEHVRTSAKGLTFIYQAALNSFWSFFSDGCNMRRDTDATIRSAGTWSTSTLGLIPSESTTTVVPHVRGILKRQYGAI